MQAKIQWNNRVLFVVLCILKNHTVRCGFLVLKGYTRLGQDILQTLMKSGNNIAVGRYVPLGNSMMILDTTNGATYKPQSVSGTLTWELFIPRLVTSDQKRLRTDTQSQPQSPL